MFSTSFVRVWVCTGFRGGGNPDRPHQLVGADTPHQLVGADPPNGGSSISCGAFMEVLFNALAFLFFAFDFRQSVDLLC